MKGNADSNDQLHLDYGVDYAPFWAVIQGYNSTTGFYSWAEVQPSSGTTGPTMPLMAGARSGTTTSAPAWEPNCSFLATGSYVMLTRGYLDPTYDWVYLAIGGANNVMNVCQSSGSGEGECPCLATCYQVTGGFTGLTDAGCTDCDGGVFTATIEMTANGPCRWRINNITTCGVFIGDLFGDVQVGLALNGTVWELNVGDGTGGGAAKYQATYAGNCTSPFTMTRLVPSGSGPDAFNGCQNWPATITVEPCTGGGSAPTVDTDTTELCSDATALTITGTNFTAFNTNTVDLRDSSNVAIANTVTSNTSTSITMTLTAPPISNLGAMTATVTNANGTSNTATVATVVDCSGATISRLSLGTATSALGAGGVSLGGLTFTPDMLYIAVLASAGGTGTGYTALSQIAAGALGNFLHAAGHNLPVLATIAGGVSVWYFKFPPGIPTGVTVTVSDNGGSGDAFFLEVIEVIGLASNAPDVLGAGNNGTASVPDDNITGPTTVANEYVQAAFFTLGTGAPQTWQNAFTAGQDQNNTISTVLTEQLEGDRILSSTGSVHAALDQIRAFWAAITVTFK